MVGRKPLSGNFLQTHESMNQLLELQAKAGQSLNASVPDAVPRDPSVPLFFSPSPMLLNKPLAQRKGLVTPFNYAGDSDTTTTPKLTLPF